MVSGDREDRSAYGLYLTGELVMHYSQRHDDFMLRYQYIPERVDDVSDEEMRRRNTTSKEAVLSKATA